MKGTIARGCGPHRAVLEALVERGDRSADTPAALDHLATCGGCERELTELALTVAALRRASRDVLAAPVPVVPAARIDALARRPDRRWSWRLELGGLLAGAAIAALVVIPGSPSVFPGWGDAAASRSVTSTWLAAETRIAATPDTRPFAAPAAVPPRYPDGLIRPRKEVLPTDATPRELEPT